MFDNTNKPKGINRVILASLNSFRAIKWLYLNESAFRQELLLLIIAIPVSFLFDISAKEQVFLLLAIVFIIFTEIVNTASRFRNTPTFRVGKRLRLCRGIFKLDYCEQYLACYLALKLMSNDELIGE